MNIKQEQKGGNGAFFMIKDIEGGEKRQRLYCFGKFKTERKQIK